MTLRATTVKIALIPLAAIGMVALTGAGPAGASTKTTTVKAIETDFHIALSKKSFSAGRYKFVAVNKSPITHALAITGPGLRNATTPNIAPGKSRDLTVSFEKGAKYDIYCPIPGHKALGMNLNVVVSGAAAHTGKVTSGAIQTTGGGSAVSY
jgi:plastocyanin